MQNNNTFNQVDSYPDPLEIINGIKFTPKEIELISCMLSGKSAKIIASFLSRSPKNIESHTRNIMKKLECNSRSGIIDFIEKSDKFTRLKEYYLDLLIQNSFKKTFQEIEKLIKSGISDCHIVYWPELEDKTHFVHQLAHYLKLAGIKIFIEIRKGFKFLNDDIDARKFPRTNIIYLIPETLVTQLSEGSEINQSKASPSIDSSTQNGGKSLFLISGGKTKLWLFQTLGKVKCVDFLEQENSYFIVFEILEKLFPTIPLEEIVREFKQQYKKLDVSQEIRNSSPSLKIEAFGEDKNNPNKLSYFLKNHKWPTLLILAFLCLCFVGFSLLKRNNQVGPSIRSDLIIPTEAVFIDRPELIAQIDATFNLQNGIQTTAVVGPGGAGKTTVARQYAHQQKADIIWEINAESYETLKSSFENLAQILAKTEDDKKALRGIQDTKDHKVREERIIQFVKERLKPHPDWVLIFDNVEKFTDIQHYFPRDADTWGEGKIILTTRDTNIQSNRHINGIVQIGELNSDQKIHLFTKIMSQGNKQPFASGQVEEAKVFLGNIPPFPLDISVAAYYLKATNTPYSVYLKNLSQYNKDFASVQENLLKESGDYAKTRYGIITLSLQHLINAHQDFKSLLLLISLLDSQNIPKDLLEKYKNTTIIDSFIYNLKKHSLITNEIIICSDIGPIFSIHRSTRSIILAYLINLMNLEKNKDFVEQIGKIIKNYGVELIDMENFPKINLLIRHFEMFLSHPHLLTDFDIASIGGELGSAYVQVCNHKKAKPLLEQSLVIYKKISYENHSWFARTSVWLGSVYEHLGNYEKAKQLYEQSLVIYRKNSNENHLGFVQALGRLGSIYREQGNYEKAKQLYEQSLVIYKKNSPGSPLHAHTLGRLGTAYREQGNYEKARQLYEQSLAIHRKNSYENHPWFARSLAGLGIIYRAQGNYEKARQLLEENLMIHRKNSYENHSWCAWTLVWMGNLYREQGNYEKARQLLEQGLFIYKKNSFENHPWFAQALAEQGCIYRDLGDYKTAKVLLERSFQIYKKTWYKDHIDIARVLRNLGQTYFKEGHVETAENYLHKALDIFQKSNHPDAYIVLEDFGDLYQKKSDLEKNGKDSKQSENFRTQAIYCLKQALEIVRVHFPKDSPHILRIETKLKKI